MAYTFYVKCNVHKIQLNIPTSQQDGIATSSEFKWAAGQHQDAAMRQDRTNGLGGGDGGVGDLWLRESLVVGTRDSKYQWFS